MKNNNKITYKKAYNLLEEAFKKAGYKSYQLLYDLHNIIFTNQNRKGTLSSKETKKLFLVLWLLEQDFPIEYITHKAYFFGNLFYIEYPLYIPNPFTERIVEKTLNTIDNLSEPHSIIDIGTGTGAIIVSILKELKKPEKHEFIATDISKHALKIAQTNATRLLPYKRQQLLKLHHAFVAYKINTSLSAYLDEKAIYQASDKEIKRLLSLLEPILPTHTNVIIITNKPYLSLSVKYPTSVKFQDQKALYSNKQFDNTLKRYIHFLKNKGYKVTLIMETRRTINPPSSKIVTYRY